MYKLNLFLHDSSIHDGETCTNYFNAKTTYGKCLHDAVKEKLLGILGCVPPWFPSKDKTCKDEVIYLDDKKSGEMKKIAHDLYVLGNINVEKQCLPPCLKVRSSNYIHSCKP